MSHALRILERSPSLGQLPGLNTDCPLWPYLAHFIEEVESRLAYSAGSREGQEAKIVINGFLTNLVQRLMNIANNVLVAESKVLERSRGGDALRLSEVYDLLRRDSSYLKDILSAYPELERLLSVVTANFISSAVELFCRFKADREAILDSFSIKRDAVVDGCEVSEGETHKGSRVVVIMAFSSGQKVVYKPRNLSIEASISGFLKTLCVEAAHPYSDWEIPNYLLREEHGWAEYKGAKAVERKEDINLYYKRMGFLLGFCTSVTASDMTSDNIIAHGAHPVPIDFETVFYSVLKQHNIPREVRWNASLTSILPNWTWKGTDGIGVDLSAIGGLTEQYVSLNLYQHIVEGDSDSFGMGGVKILPNDNVLYFDGEPVKPWNYEADLKEGFDKCFEVMRNNCQDVSTVIKRFGGMYSRYVPRATATYHYAVQCSLHPTLMSSTEGRENFLRAILSSDTPPAQGFLDSEVAACMDNDIPYARMKLGELCFVEPFYGGTGDLDKDCYQDGISHSVDYISTMSSNRLNFERNLIGSSLAAMRNMYEHQFRLAEERFKVSDPLEGLAAYDLKYVKDVIARAVESNSSFIRSKIKEEIEQNGFWLGFHASSGGYMEYSELGDDFYYGLTGILYGCVVASKYSLCSGEIVCSLKDLCFARVMNKFENPGSQLGGFHFGLASAVVPLYISLEALSDSRSEILLGAFKEYLERVLADAFWQKYFLSSDLLAGISGCLTVITKMYEMTGDEYLAVLANKLYAKGCCQWVQENGDLGLSFDKSITVRRDGLLSGVSHGLMGCAYSVYYYNRTIAKSEEVERLGQALLSWELNEFDGFIKNWPDYRVRSEARKGEFAWSHGLPGNFLVLHYLAKEGVELARMFLRDHPADKYFSFEALLERKRPVNDSLCHGAYGVLNIIKQLSPSNIQDHRIYFWANLINFCEQDTRELRVRTADASGLWVGKVGSLLGGIGLTNDNYCFPFLPHQMDLVQ